MLTAVSFHNSNSQRGFLSLLWIVFFISVFFHLNLQFFSAYGASECFSYDARDIILMASTLTPDLAKSLRPQFSHPIIISMPLHILRFLLDRYLLEMAIFHLASCISWTPWVTGGHSSGSVLPEVPGVDYRKRHRTWHPFLLLVLPPFSFECWLSGWCRRYLNMD